MTCKDSLSHVSNVETSCTRLHKGFSDVSRLTGAVGTVEGGVCQVCLSGMNGKNSDTHRKGRDAAMSFCWDISC